MRCLSACEAISALAEERQGLIETLRGERDQAREEGRAAQQAHDQALQTLRATHEAERDGLRQQIEQGRVLVEELRLEQAREREIATGQEQHYVRVIDEGRAEREALKQQLASQARASQQRLQALSEALAEQQRLAMRAEPELEVACEEQARLRAVMAEGERALVEVRVREQLAVAQRDKAREVEWATRERLQALQVRWQEEPQTGIGDALDGEAGP